MTKFQGLCELEQNRVGSAITHWVHCLEADIKFASDLAKMCSDVFTCGAGVGVFRHMLARFQPYRSHSYKCHKSEGGFHFLFPC